MLIYIKNTLYVAIVLESIKKDGLYGQEVVKNVAQQYPTPSSNISIRDLLKKINPQYKRFYKDIPKQFFKDEKLTLDAIEKNTNLNFKRPSRKSWSFVFFCNVFKNSSIEKMFFLIYNVI